ncbi:MAG: hypothetical protein ACR2LK_02650 [Solirubrobacteraceae bacterium]
MRRWPLLSITVLAAVAAAPSAAAQTPIATTEHPTPIREWRGIAVFSVYDAGIDRFRLVISRNGGAPQRVPVATRPVDFDADIGPDSKRRPAIVYSRCERESPPRRDCDLYRYSLTAEREDRIRNSDSDAASEYQPTIWRGRIAWARSYDRRPQGNPVVYTRPLVAPRNRRSQRLPGIPARRCDAMVPGNRCQPTSAGQVDELELYGRWLAQSLIYEYNGAGGVCGRREVRLVRSGGRVSRIGDQTCGLNGQSWAGLSFSAGRLYVARFCVANPSCGRRYGAYRYRLRTGDYQLAQFGRRLTGFAYAGGGRAYEVRAPDTDRGYCGNSLPDEPRPLCQVVLTDPLDFGPARPPR